MDKEELFEKPQYLGVEDIKRIFDCGNTKAWEIIRNIKSVSDRLNISGKVTISDYEKWYTEVM